MANMNVLFKEIYNILKNYQYIDLVTDNKVLVMGGTFDLVKPFPQIIINELSQDLSLQKLGTSRYSTVPVTLIVYSNSHRDLREISYQIEDLIDSSNFTGYDVLDITEGSPSENKNGDVFIHGLPITFSFESQ